jgi:lysophospholipase L1-like esterase
MKSIRIFFHGDSVSFGQGVSPHLTWVTRISQKISTDMANSDSEFVFSNSGVNGNTTRQGLDRMHYDVLSHRPHIAVIQFGLNDCNYWKTDLGHPRVSPKAFEANLDEMIGRLRTFGCERIILNSNHPTTRNFEVMPDTSITYEESNRAYNEIIRLVAAKQRSRDFIFNDIGRMIDDHLQSSGGSLKDYLLVDGLHLSEHGHSFYFEAIYPSILESLSIVKGDLTAQ